MSTQQSIHLNIINSLYELLNSAYVFLWILHLKKFIATISILVGQEVWLDNGIGNSSSNPGHDCYTGHWMFPYDLGDRRSIQDRVTPKTQKMVLDATLLNTQHYKLRIKGKMEHPGKVVVPPLHLGVVAIERGAFVSPSTKSRLFYLLMPLEKVWSHLFSSSYE